MRYLLALLAIAGLVVSVLALREHYRTEPAPCAINSTWDCGAVNHSDFATLHGALAPVLPKRLADPFQDPKDIPAVLRVPVADIGIAGYAVIALLALLRRRVSLLFAVLLGMAFALRLTYVEYNILETWCVFCVISQGIIALILFLSAGWAVVGGRARRTTMG